MKRISMKSAYIMLALTAAFLGGCASPAMKESMIPQGTQLSKSAPGSKFYQKIKDIEVTGGRETNPIGASQVSSEDFKYALEDALKKSELSSQKGKYYLSANLITLDQPFEGLGMTVRATVDYLIKDKTNGKVIFDETIESSFTAGLSDAFLGVERLRIANEGAIRRNIQLLLKKLSKN